MSLYISGCSKPAVNPSSSDVSVDSEAQSGEIHHGGSWEHDENEHWKTCEECGEHYLVAPHDYTTRVLDDTATYTCICGYSYQESVPTSLSTLTIDEDTFYNYGSYDTGNYGSKSISGWDIEYYRIYRYYGYCFALKPNFSEGDGTLPGALLNTSSAGLIWSITISYTASEDFSLYYGNNAERSHEFSIQAQENGTQEILCGKSRFFLLDSGSSDVYITSMVIKYISDSYEELENVKPNTYDYRISPTTYNGDLVDGETQVSMPTSIKVNGDTYTITSTKTYTYYSFNYARDNSDEASEIALTTKEDVANYYLAFHRFPANYATSDTRNMVKAIFGSNTRLAQTFDRMDGYATAVPFNGNPPTYHELDIGIPGADYNVSGGRGVGRLVIWEDGFVPYGSDVVIVYTDDHYYTFQEYLNYGSFGDRFNAEGTRVSHSYESAITLSRG